MIADTINAGFEFVAGFAVLLHCWQLHKDKDVKGTSLLAVAFFVAWGVWNLFYYPHLNQPLSFFAGIFVFAANALWLMMLARYGRKRAEGKASEDDVESEVMMHLVRAWDAHLRLSEKHPDFTREFRFHIHALQDKLDARRFRRRDA